MAASRVLSTPPGLSSTPDRDLADRHRYGDKSAFEEIYVRHSPMVFHLCLRLTGDPNLAQDLSQEVFLRVFKGLRRFRGRSQLKTWIYRITVNHCRGRLARRRLRTEPFTSPSGEAGIADPARGPEERMLARDAGRQVAAALTRLPPRFREAVVLRDIEGLSYREIAEVLGVRLGTVRSRIARGRERLRDALLGEDEG